VELNGFRTHGLVGQQLRDLCGVHERSPGVGECAHPPALPVRRQAPTTGNQVACSAQTEAQIDSETTTNVRAWRAEMFHQLASRSGFLQGVGQHGQAMRVQFTAGELPFIVCGAGESDDGGSAVGWEQDDRAEGVAYEITEDGLLPSFLRFFSTLKL